MNKFSTLANRLSDMLKAAGSDAYFGFVEGHAHITEESFRKIERALSHSESYVPTFENHFAQLIGGGDFIAFAAARMGFYSVLKALGIGKDDEVILNGATCSVMPNAVLKAGARPVYSDIDKETFGSCPQSLKKLITRKTKAIVAQHSFGIPCKIVELTDLCRSKGLPLIEDCALALDSQTGGKSVGTFGLASIFSTDHSKPINTLTGGGVYTEDSTLSKTLRSTQESAAELSASKKQALFDRLILERKNCRFDRLGFFQLIDAFNSRIKSHLGGISPFLDRDFFPHSHTAYPYPAKLPSFLALLGLMELERWPETRDFRKKAFQKYFELLKSRGLERDLPRAYFDSSLDIVPHRIAWTPSNPQHSRDRFSGFLQTSWTWFCQPIIVARGPLESYGYTTGDCPISEDIGKKIINFPTSLPSQDLPNLLNLISKAL